MEVQQLKHLMAAVQYGNLLKAAEETNISQSGLSRSIKSLEHRLGVQLLVRSSKGVEPTVFGEAVLRRAKIIMNEVARAQQEVEAMREARLGPVTVGITQNYASYVVPEILLKVAQQRPDLSVTVTTGGFVELAQRARLESIDFGFGILGPLKEQEDLVIEPLTRQRSRVFARAGHPLANRKGLKPGDLSSARWALLSSESVQRSFTGYFERHGFHPEQGLKTDSIDLIRRLIRDTDELTVLPREPLAQDLEDGKLVELDCESPLEEAQIAIFYRDAELLTPQARYLIDGFRATFGQPVQGRGRAAWK